MVEGSERFEVVMEPTNSWLVWDKVRDAPAEYSGAALSGLSYAEALMHCELLNEAELVQKPARSRAWRFDCRVVHAGPRNRRPNVDSDEPSAA